MIAPAIATAVLIALIGWLATIRAISTSSLRSTLKPWLLLPSWIPWMVLALGAPILGGSLALNDALNMAGAMTAGMIVSIVLARRRAQR